ncbi:MAG: tRNA pseudouridine(55) synthase TruB [Propionibacteriaceae bacterium]|jgi:tRNA pseudouridine55 synthase|nr:tRNA pseudouridine(55) synthase TruB [Propionibacteriaceae bacterium]
MSAATFDRPLPDGVIVVDKPAGLTSQAVVSRVKRALGVRKAGHAGTLDPMATGVLVVGLGRATRLLGYLAGHDKRYLATIRLGQATTTDDAEGEPLATAKDATEISDAAINSEVAGFTGNILQVPSAVSAIKVAGVRAYALARAGENVTLQPRAVTVTRFEVLARRNAAPFVDLEVDVECSSGTYIRALARDLGVALNVGGHLQALRRLRVGAFSIEQATPLDAITNGVILSAGVVAKTVFEWRSVSAMLAIEVEYGRPVPLSVSANPTALLNEAGTLLGLYRPDERAGWASPVAVFV